MPAFTAVGAYVAGTVFGLVGTAAVVVGALVATGAAYITSRIINGNPNKGNNSAAGSQGGRIQVPPATNNKIPVVYGNAFINGIITDARLITTDNKINDTMYYCIVLSETCNNVSSAYTVNDIYWNDLRLTFDATSPYKVKDGRKNVDNPDGVTEDFIDTNFVSDNKNLVEVRVYSGGSAAANQIFPTTGTTPAYTYWAGNDGSWDSTYAMKGLVFAIVKVTYNGEKGFTGLPNMTFRINNNISNPADVWYDYMTSQRYGAGIDAGYIDTTAQTAWANFCDEDITYTDKDGATNQSFARYAINGPIDTSRDVKTNIDIIMQNAGAWLSYDVTTGLWSPIIKKAVTAGEVGLSATYFTASRTGSTLTVTNFPAGRIEAGQLLYNSSGTLIGTISAQLTPTAGETAGQIGRYTTSTSGSITSTTFYTLPATMLAFTDDNIISGITISSTRLDDLYNSVEAEFYDKHNKDQRAYARNEIDSGDRNPNEPDNQLRLNLDLCNNSMQADLLGQLELRQSRDDLVVEFTTNHYGIQAQAGDVVSITSELYDWNPKYFRVMRVKEQETEEGGLVAQIQALEYNPDVYTVEPITEFSTSANIGIGVYAASPNLPQPPVVEITQIDTDVAIPNFQLQIKIPTTGGPYDEIELYYTEGWDPMSITGSVVPGTGSNGAPVGDGLLTVTAVDYGAINIGDYFTVGSTSFTVTSQLTNDPVSKTFASGGAAFTNTVTLNNTTGLKIGNNLTGTGLPTAGAHITAIAGSQITLDTAFSAQASGTYAVFGGLGTYVVDTSATLSGTTTLYDLPVNDDYKYLKKVTPEGDNPTFTNGESITVVITEVPANTQTYRRWFVKARMGIKKRFGSFSTPTITDLDGNFRYTPNPVASGTLGDLSDVDVSTKAEGDILYYDATTGKWRNTPILSIDDTGNIGIDVNSTKNNRLNTESSLTDTPTAPLVLRHTSSGTPVAGFGTTLGFETETPGSGIKTAGYIDFQMTDATPGSEDFTFGIGLMQGGVEPSPTLLRVFTVSSDGDATLTGDNLRLNSNDAGVDVAVYFNSVRNLKWDHGSQRFEFNDDLYIEDNLTVAGSTSLGNNYILDQTDVVGQFKVTNNSVDNLFVDRTTGYVGINDNTPSYNLDVNGTANIETSLTVPSITTLTGDDLNISAFSGRDITISVTNSTDPVTVVRNTTATNSSIRTLTLRTNSSGTPAAGFGNALTYEIETAPGVTKEAGYIDVSASNVGTGTETFSMSFGLMNAGATYTTVANLNSIGDLQIDGDLTVSGDNIKKSTGTTVVTFSGTNLTTFAGDIVVSGNTIQSSSAAAIELSGADVNVQGDLTVSGNDIKSSTDTAITLSGADVAVLGGLNVDSGTLFVDKTTNRVGVNNVSPTQALDVTGNIEASGDIDAGGSLLATNRVDVGGSLILFSTGFGPSVETQTIYDPASGTSLQTADSWATISYRTAKYTVSMRKGTDYHCMEIMVLHDDTTAYMNTYSEMFTNASLATFSVDISAGQVRLRVTPATVGTLEIVLERKLFVAI